MYPTSYAYPPSNGAESYGYAYNGYGAPGYPGAPPSYPVAALYGGGAPPPSSSASLSNPATFEHMYRGQLAQLTFNSKPIITNLTLIAQEHVHRMATLVAKLIDTHIIMAPPAYRLPSMYLMDSISKNIGSPYTELWAPRVATLFLESYRLVDQPTKRRMEELLATWRATGPGGRPLFGENAQYTIERSLFGGPAPTPRPAQPTQSQVLANIERLLALKTQERSRNPQDESISDRIHTLRELRDKVQFSDTSPELLAEVQKELDTLHNQRPEAREMSAQATPPPSTAAPGGTAPAASASELISNLMKAGLLPSTQSAPTPTVVQRTSQDKAYTDYILSLDLRLTTMDLSRPPPEIELVIKENLPLPCRQCANRYPDSAAGKNGLDHHLDWHFSQNRRSRASIARGQSRSWLDPASRWIRSGFDDTVQLVPGEEQDAVITPAQEQVLREKFASTYVVVPDDPEMAACPCRICKEKFQSEWSEDVEEWIWKNALELDGSYVHASCHYSAKTMSESVNNGAPAEQLHMAPTETAPVETGPEPGTMATYAAVDADATPIKEEEVNLKRKASPSDTPPHKKMASVSEPINE